MLTRRRRSCLMFIRIKSEGKRDFQVPIPLFVLEHTLRSVADFFWVWKQIINPFRIFRKKVSSNKQVLQSHISDLINQSIILFRELRKYGRWKMVDIEDCKTSVQIDFY